MAIDIPKNHLAPLRTFSSLSPAHRQAFVDEMKQSAPALSLPHLAERLAPKVEQKKETVLDILKMLASMYEALRFSKREAEKFAADVEDAAKKLGDEFVPPDEDWAAFTQSLAEILSLDTSFGVASKALGVMTDHHYVYCTSRVLTDIRPVFGDKATNPPNAATIVHMLRISYHVQATQIRDFFVAMDDNDVRQLRDSLERALTKANSLRTVLEKAELPLLDVESD